MKINIHAGHAAEGKGAIGAVGIISESKEDRIVKEYVIAKLKALGHTVYDCTVDSGSASAVLKGIVKKCNAHKVDIDVSIHFNSGDRKSTR
jgi:N-acetylmuramoyl-L-alanine amidase